MFDLIFASMGYQARCLRFHLSVAVPAMVLVLLLIDESAFGSFVPGMLAGLSFAIPMASLSLLSREDREQRHTLHLILPLSRRQVMQAQAFASLSWQLLIIVGVLVPVAIPWSLRVDEAHQLATWLPLLAALLSAASQAGLALLMTGLGREQRWPLWLASVGAVVLWLCPGYWLLSNIQSLEKPVFGIDGAPAPSPMWILLLALGSVGFTWLQAHLVARRRTLGAHLLPPFLRAVR